MAFKEMVQKWAPLMLSVVCSVNAGCAGSGTLRNAETLDHSEHTAAVDNEEYQQCRARLTTMYDPDVVAGNKAVPVTGLDFEIATELEALGAKKVGTMTFEQIIGMECKR